MRSCQDHRGAHRTGCNSTNDTGLNYDVNKSSAFLMHCCSGDEGAVSFTGVVSIWFCQYLVASVKLPITGQITKASSDFPYLALKLEFTLRLNEGLYVSKIEPSLLDAITRLVRLRDSSKDIKVTLPSNKKRNHL
jgi:hypothetical protein